MTMKSVLFLAIGTSLCFLSCDDRSQDEPGRKAGEERARMDAPKDQKATAEDVEREAHEAAETAAEYSKQQAEEIRQEVKDKLAELDAKLEELKKRGEGLSEEARQEWQTRMERVSEKRKAL
jgi:hypothetical protein